MPTSFFALLDDIATVLDSVAGMTKIAAKKTAGVLGDDLALNAQQVAGVKADRELPVVWAVAKGSVRNKLILVPAALAISTFVPRAILPLLMLGGAFLCYEGFEKILHKLLHGKEEAEHQTAHLERVANPAVDLVALEREKIAGAIRTDFILSAEIIVISLGTVAGENFLSQLTVLGAISAIMTVGVYGLVAGIVKLDDGGLYLVQRAGVDLAATFARRLGRGLLLGAPWLMKALSVVGTAAMFMVGGGIVVHGLPGLENGLASLAPPGFVGDLFTTFAAAGIGIVVGALVLAAVTAVKRLTGSFSRS